MVSYKGPTAEVSGILAAMSPWRELLRALWVSY
jgi:hypothetical protein